MNRFKSLHTVYAEGTEELDRLSLSQRLADILNEIDKFYPDHNFDGRHVFYAAQLSVQQVPGKRFVSSVEFVKKG